MSEPKRHHYIPRVYLRGFTTANSSGKVVVYDKSNDRIFTTSIDNVAVIGRYYTVTTPGPGMNGDSVEAMLSETESAAAPVLEKLRANQRIANDERAIACYFFGLLAHRGPAARSFAEKLMRAQVQAVADLTFHDERRYNSTIEQMRAAGKETGPLISFAEMKEFNEQRHYTIEINPQVTLVSLLGAQTLASALYRMQWKFARTTADDHCIAASDNPVLDVIPGRRLNASTRLGPCGIGHRNVEISVPIGRDCAMVATWPRNSLYPRDVINAVNVRTIANASRYVFLPHEDRGLLGLCQKYRHLSQRHEIVVSGSAETGFFTRASRQSYF